MQIHCTSNGQQTIFTSKRAIVEKYPGSDSVITSIVSSVRNITNKHNRTFLYVISLLNREKERRPFSHGNQRGSVDRNAGHRLLNRRNKLAWPKV